MTYTLKYYSSTGWLNAEAAELFRSDPDQFASLVKRSLRGYSVQGIEFDKLV